MQSVIARARLSLVMRFDIGLHREDILLPFNIGQEQSSKCGSFKKRKALFGVALHLISESIVLAEGCMALWENDKLITQLRILPETP
jgi:hypothetical protein